MRYDLHPPTDFADPEVALLFAALEDGTRDWREDMAADGEPDADRLQWPLFPNGHSIGAVFLHIADVEIQWVETRLFGLERDFVERKFLGGLDIDMENSRWPEPPRLTLQEHFMILDGVRNRTRRLLAEVEADRLFESRGHTLTVRWLINHLIGHEAYHAGQALLIRQALGF